MKLRKLSIFILQLCIFTMVFTINTDNIYASEKKKSPLRIVMNLNDFSSVSNAKEALINSLIDYNMYPELAGHINYEASELKTTSLNLSKAGQQRTAVQLVIKTNHQLSENKLFKDIISTTVEFDIRDLESPVITSRKDKLQRSIHAELDPYQLISVTDNSTEEITLNYTTDYNNQIPGDYFITYTATDTAGNFSTLTLPIKVTNQRYTNYTMDSSMIDEMFLLINEYRASYGLEPFELAPANGQHALGVRACEARSFLSHDRPDGRHYKTVLDEYGVEYSSPFEILSFAGTSASDGLNWWKNSPDHNARLLTRISNKIAIGTCDGLWAAIVYND